MDGVSGASWNSGEVAPDVYAARTNKEREMKLRNGEAKLMDVFSGAAAHHSRRKWRKTAADVATPASNFLSPGARNKGEGEGIGRGARGGFIAARM